MLMLIHEKAGQLMEFERFTRLKVSESRQSNKFLEHFIISIKNKKSFLNNIEKKLDKPSLFIEIIYRNIVINNILVEKQI